MTDTSQALAAHLANRVIHACLCWRLTRRDGMIIGLTDHDRPLTIDKIVYHPGAGLDAGQFTQGHDLKPGRAAAAGVLSSQAISEQALADGLWDLCRVDVYRADWTRPDLGTLAIWSGFLSEITQTERGGFEAELISLKAELERPAGRVLTRQCDAVLGDSRCTIAANGRVCDQRFETCRDIFANTENFRGFPHMPGPDFVLAGPAASGNNGGKR